MAVRTWQPKKGKRAKTHGFRERSTKVLQRRRAKGRHSLVVKRIVK